MTLAQAGPAIGATPAQKPLAAFLFDLLQDVSVLRPIIRTLAQSLDIDLLMLYSAQFERRDKQRVWMSELEELAVNHGAALGRFDGPFEAVLALQAQGQGRPGLLFSASESNLPAHAVNHNVFLSTPSEFVRITVQHGYECVGFNQNREQTLAHGSTVRFAADVLCGWVPIDALRHLCPSERGKYVEIGPPLVLNRLFDVHKGPILASSGLVCENLHSVRMRTTGAFQATYLDTLLEFAARQGAVGRRIALRPHPGGQFVIKNKVELPRNVALANKPMFKTDLEGFAYGISAPSSVLIDMVLARIPTAVWSDGDDLIDTSAYSALKRVRTVDDWVAFADDVARDPQPFLERQERFLRQTRLDVDPHVVRDRLVALVRGLLPKARPRAAPRRVLLVANGVVPTLHISFLKPLAALAEQGQLHLTVLTEKDVLRARDGTGDAAEASMAEFARNKVEQLRPDIAVFCRYSGPAASAMVARLREAGVPVIFHIDDDLLNVPRELGERKFLEHNRSERTSTVRFLLDQADLVYCSTPRLRERFIELGIDRELSSGKIYCTGDVVSPAERRETKIIGFMGNDKTPELMALVPVISAALERHPGLRFELFGSMAMPDELARFGDRISATPPISDYDAFVEKFQQLRWDIGLCPLHVTPFNVVKANTKWVDYTSIGAAVIASRGTAYDDCCSGGCGELVSSLDDWSSAMERLIANPDARYRQVVAAQARLREDYSQQRLTQQVLAMFDAAAERAAQQESSGQCPASAG